MSEPKVLIESVRIGKKRSAARHARKPQSETADEAPFEYVPEPEDTNAFEPAEFSPEPVSDAASADTDSEEPDPLELDSRP